MIRKLTGLFKKLIDRQEEIIDRDDEQLNDLLDLDPETVTVTDIALTIRSNAPPYKYDDGSKWGEATWG